MSSWMWVSKTLKNLGLIGTTPSTTGAAAVQSRLFGAQAGAAATIPIRPKKPLTPYFRFMGEIRENFKKENPSLKPTELMKKIAVRWDNLDDDTKSKYIVAYKNDMEGYSSILQKYNSSLTPEQRELQQQLKFERQVKKEKREKKKRLKELGRPKRPTSGFLLFLKNKVTPGASIEEYQQAAKQAAAAWRKMSDADKLPFVSKYKEELQTYEKSIAKWEEKMMKQGNNDVVRSSSLSALSKASSKNK